MPAPAPPRSSSLPKWFRIAGVCLLALLAADCGLVAIKWPFKRSAVQHLLEHAADAPVEIASVQPKYFPHPGCIVRGVVIHHREGGSTPPLITVDTIDVESDYASILTFSPHLHSLRTDGMHIRILSGKSEGSSGGGDGKMGVKMVIDELSAHRTTLEFLPSAPGKRPFVLVIHRARLAPVSGSRKLAFDADLRVPEPPGEVHASGHFGPWNKNDPFEIPVSGLYTFTRADLGFASGIAGLLDSRGRFSGVLRRIEVEGATHVPDFMVRSAHRAVSLATTYRATVNGQTGDVTLQSVDAHFRHSAVRASGAIAQKAPHHGKRVNLEMSVPDGRIEDFLYLLTQTSPPGMFGALTIRCRVGLQPGDGKFLRKLEMNGAFRIARARFGKPQTQHSLDRISRRAQGEKIHGDAATDGNDDGDDGPDVLSNLQGRISVARGTATISDATFEVPGATASLSGTYDLLREEVNLHGVAHLQNTLSKTVGAHGFKSFLLKIVQPFVEKRRGRGADVPIKITGRWGKTNLSLDFGPKQ